MKNIKMCNTYIRTLLVVIVSFLSLQSVFGQGYREYWFDVPEVNRGHVIKPYNSSPTDKHPFDVYLHLTAVGGPTSVKLSLPAEPGFTPQVFDIPASGKIRINLTSHGMPGTFEKDWFYQPYHFGNPRTCPIADRDKYIENILDWSESDLTAPRPYINRTKKGVLLQSVKTTHSGMRENNFNAYLEIASPANREMMVLKGSSAKGRYFAVPMQTNYSLSDRRYNKMQLPPYRSINITATEDNTKVRIKFKHDIWMNTNAPGTNGKWGVRISKDDPRYSDGLFFWLNKGETSIITPYEEHFSDKSPSDDLSGVDDGYQTGRKPNATFPGIIVESVQQAPASGGYVVVTYQEGLAMGPNPDIIMDQIVPIYYLGNNYGVVRGISIPSVQKEYFYIMAGNKTATVKVTDYPTPITIPRYTQKAFPMKGTRKAYAIESDEGILVLHVSGAETSVRNQGQRGGALLPPLSSEKHCAGSKVVDFSRARTKAAGYTFYLNMIAYVHPTDPDLVSVGNFELFKTRWNNATTPPTSSFGKVSSGDPEKQLEDYLNDISNWNQFDDVSPTSKLKDWRWIQVDVDALIGNDKLQVTDSHGNFMAYRIRCKNNVFQLGVLNGDGETDALYGYFSEFRRIEPGIRVTNEQGFQESGGHIPICRGDKLTLNANIGLPYARYDWSPPTYLSSVTDPKVDVINPKQTIRYSVVVSRFCDFQPKSEITVEVHPDISPILSGPSVLCGTGEIPLELGELAGAKKLNMVLQEVIGPGDTLATPAGNEYLTNQKTFPKVLNFPTAVPPGTEKQYVFRATVSNDGCTRYLKHEISVYPKLKTPILDYLAAYTPPPGKVPCAPFQTQLGITNNTTDPYPAGTRFRWLFHDGNEEVPASSGAPEYPFNLRAFDNNTTSITNLVQKLYVVDANDNCKDSAEFTIKVAPRVSAEMDLDPSTVCEGRLIQIGSATQGETERKWTLTNLHDPTEVLPSSAAAKFVLPNGLHSGLYLVKLTASNPYCDAVTTGTLRVNPQPKLHSFNVVHSSAPACYPYKVQFTGEMSQATHYEWQLMDAPGQPIPTLLESGVIPTTPPGPKPLLADFTLENSLTYSTYRFIRLKLTTIDGCELTKDTKLEVPPNLEVTFKDGEFSGCPDAEGKFNPRIRADIFGASVNPENKAWYVDGERVTHGTDPDLFEHDLVNDDYTNVKEYDIRFEVTTAGGCKKSVSQKVTVYPRLSTQWDLTYVDSDGVTKTLGEGENLCTPARALFSATGPDKMIWTFSDGSQTEGRSGYKDLVNGTDMPIPFTITLNARNAYCQEKPFVRSINLMPTIRASFRPEIIEKCNPVKVKVTNTSYPSTGLTLTWLPVGGVPDPLLPDHYIFTDAGTKSIGLRVTNSEGCSAEAPAFPVQVPDLLRADLAPLKHDEAVFCAPGSVTFTSRSTGARTYAWDFGDGTTLPAGTMDRVTHTFQNTTNAPITYTVKLHITGDVPGCDNAPAATTSVDVQVYPQVFPISNVTASIMPPCQTARVTIENSSTNASEYHWTFTPDDLVNGQKLEVPMTTQTTIYRDLVNHSPDKVIRYGVHFEASKQWLNGPRCTASKELTFIDVPPEIKPNISITNGAQVCSDDVPRSFANNTKGGTPDLVHEWHFGDGTDVVTSQNNEVVNHQFINTTDADVTYQVYVVSRQPNISHGGCQVQSSPISVLVHPRVVAKMAVQSQDFCASPMLVDFKNESLGSTAASGVTSNYEWLFGDGNRREDATKTNFTQSFRNDDPNQSKTYTIKLKASQTHAVSGKTCTSTTESDLLVPPVMSVQIKVSPTELCSDNDPVTFSATPVGGNTFKYKWDFGDNMGVETPTASHVYSNSTSSPKQFVVTLRVENEHGCVATAVETVTVYPRPKASFTLNWTDQCTPYVINVTNNSSVGAHYEWVLDGDAQTFPDTYNLTPITVDNQTEEIRNLTLRLKVSSGSCHDETSVPIVVPPRLVPAFQLTRNEGCNPVRVGFTNQSRGGTGLRYSWDLVDFGSTDETTPADRTYSNPDKVHDRVINISLTARNPFGCKETVTQPLTIWPKLDASFSATPLEGCSPLTVSYSLLDVSTSPAYNYTWHIGTSDYDGQYPPDQIYENPSPDASTIYTKEVSLEVSLAAHPECRLMSSQKVRVYPSVLPEFAYTSEGCHPLPIELRSTSRVYGAAKYEWLVDGQSVGNTPTFNYILENPSHTSDKEYTVELRATSEQGCVGVKEHKIVVWPKPLANFDFVGAALHCPPYLVHIDVAKSEGVNLTYQYDLGDGRQAESQELSGIDHTYQNATDHEVSYLASLTVTTTHGCSDYTQRPIAIYPQVYAGFQFVPDGSGCSPLELQMQNQSKNADYYDWDFGDSSGDTKENPTHSFVNGSDIDKTFTVRLVARAQTGCTGEVTHTIPVFPPPHSALSVTPVSSTFPDPDVPVTLVNQTFPAPGTWSYNWSFGDGTFSQDQHPAPHLYTTWGELANGFQIPITLTVVNGTCRDEVTNYITIRAPQPVATFVPDVAAGCPPLKVLFEDKNTKYAKTFEWDFGDGTTSTSRRPEHIFSEPGKYSVMLTAKGDGGEHSTHTLIEVYRRPAVDFKFAPEKLQLPHAKAQFLNLTHLGSVYEWTFGDGATSTEENPEHAYQDPGYYDVTLYARSEHGCEATRTKKDYVYVSGAGYLEFPNAFSPSISGTSGGYYQSEGERNQIFHPYNTTGIKEYKLMIFNRSGEQIFESQDLYLGWDGYYNNMLCPDGVYTWRAVGAFYDGSLFDLKGNVTLLSVPN